MVHARPFEGLVTGVCVGTVATAARRERER
jgi:hypothetical protein